MSEILNSKLFLILIAIIPEIIIGYIVYKMDKEKEPLSILIPLVSGGVLSCLCVLQLTYYLSEYFEIFSLPIEYMNIKQMLIYSFICISLMEEGFKYLFLYLISYHSREFDYTFDMIVYGVFLSLGFSTFENIFSAIYNGYQVGLLRAITAVPLHACTGAFMGIFLSIAKQRETYKLGGSFKYKVLALLLPVILHGIYDYCTFSNVFTVLIIIVIMFSTVTVFNINIHNKFDKKLKKDVIV